MPATKPLLKLDPALTSDESLYALLSYEAGIDIDEDDLTLASIAIHEASEDDIDPEFNTVLTLNVNPVTEKFKHTESTVQKRVIRHTLEDYVAHHSLSLAFEDDLTLYDDAYALAKINSVLGTNFSSEQVVLDYPNVTRAYAPDSMVLTFGLKDDADVRLLGSLTFMITDAIDRRTPLDELFTSTLLSGFALPEADSETED